MIHGGVASTSAMLLAAALALSCGCATTRGTATDGHGAGHLPVGPIPACEPGTGLSLESPISSDSGFLKLLAAEYVMCPGGAIASIRAGDRTGGTAVACPDFDAFIFTSDDSRLDCSPEPFSIIDPAAIALNRRAVAELADGHLASGLKLSRKALKLNEKSEALLMALAAAWMANANFREAEKALSGALSINPGSVRVRLAHAVAMSELGNKTAYAAEIGGLYRDVPETDPLHWELTCRLADNHNRIGNRIEAIKMARKACENGVGMCCGLAASDTEAIEVVPGTKDPAPTEDGHGAM